MKDALSGWKTIVVFLDNTPEGEIVGRQAAELARRCGAHLIGIHALADYLEEHPAASFALGAEAVSGVIAEKAADERNESRGVRHRLQAIVQKHGISGEIRIIRGERGDDDLVAAARCCDLIVLGYPDPPGLPKTWPADRLLMENGGPMLIVPTRAKAGTIGRNIVVAWNASREARRAVREAMPLLSAADSVTVLVVDPESSGHKFHEGPGVDLARYLARHGVQARISRLETHGSSVAEAILSATEAQAADLVVIGAYSHARLAEEIFGGVTRTLLARALVPLFLSA
ncbi:MAG TPA: universal stress protein [Acetobacteraceae bacterium]|nr:universal stress protein [Acetobacteraceae bacterium]